jgi:hypothetical protein
MASSVIGTGGKGNLPSIFGIRSFILSRDDGSQRPKLCGVMLPTKVPSVLSEVRSKEHHHVCTVSFLECMNKSEHHYFVHYSGST